MSKPARPRRLAAAGVLAFAALALAAPPAGAQDHSLSRYGGRLGLTSDPDQFHLGVYAGFGELAPDFQLRPSVDLGFGDDIFSVIVNADVQYFFQIENAQLRPYLGGGLGLGYYDFDPGDTTEIGISLYGGAEKALGDYKTASLEFRVGIDELPDFKITLGLGFY